MPLPASRQEFPKLDARFVEFVADRFDEKTGLRMNRDIAGVVFDALDRKPGSFVGIAQAMVQERKVDFTAHLAAALENERSKGEINLMTHGLRDLDKRVLAAVLQGKQVYAAGTLADYATDMGLPAVSVGTAQRAMQKLREKGLVEQNAETKEYRLANESWNDPLRDMLGIERKAPPTEPKQVEHKPERPKGRGR